MSLIETTGKFDAEAYDVYHLGLSGGKDSTAMLLWFIYCSGLDPKKLHVTFCDTSNEDELTYSYIQMLQWHVFRGVEWPHDNHGLLIRAYQKGMFPSRKFRWCTQLLKIAPTREVVKNLMVEHENVLCLSGVRKDEGKAGANDRGDLPEYGFEEGFYCDVWRPIYNLSIDDIWRLHKNYLNLDYVLEIIETDEGLSEAHKAEIITRMKSHGIPRNPLYDMGAKRVGCYPCMQSSKNEIRNMVKYRPERIDHIREMEELITARSKHGQASFFHRNTVPAHYHSGTYINEDSETISVCTIDDVAEWSQHSRGIKRHQIHLFDELEESPASTCNFGGFCE